MKKFLLIAVLIVGIGLFQGVSARMYPRDISSYRSNPGMIRYNGYSYSYADDRYIEDDRNREDDYSYSRSYKNRSYNDDEDCNLNSSRNRNYRSNYYNDYDYNDYYNDYDYRYDYNDRYADDYYYSTSNRSSSRTCKGGSYDSYFKQCISNNLACEEDIRRVGGKQMYGDRKVYTTSSGRKYVLRSDNKRLYFENCY